MKKEKQGILRRLKDYLLAWSRKSANRCLQVAQRLLEANPGDEKPFEARHVNMFLARLSKGSERGRILRRNYILKSFFRALGHPFSRPIWDRGGRRVHLIGIVPYRDRTGYTGRRICPFI